MKFFQGIALALMLMTAAIATPFANAYAQTGPYSFSNSFHDDKLGIDLAFPGATFKGVEYPKGKYNFEISPKDIDPQYGLRIELDVILFLPETNEVVRNGLLLRAIEFDGDTFCGSRNPFESENILYAVEPRTVNNIKAFEITCAGNLPNLTQVQRSLVILAQDKIVSYKFSSTFDSFSKVAPIINRSIETLEVKNAIDIKEFPAKDRISMVPNTAKVYESSIPKLFASYEGLCQFKEVKEISCTPPTYTSLNTSNFIWGERAVPPMSLKNDHIMISHRNQYEYDGSWKQLDSKPGYVTRFVAFVTSDLAHSIHGERVADKNGNQYRFYEVQNRDQFSNTVYDIYLNSTSSSGETRFNKLAFTYKERPNVGLIGVTDTGLLYLISGEKVRVFGQDGEVKSEFNLANPFPGVNDVLGYKKMAFGKTDDLYLLRRDAFNSTIERYSPDGKLVSTTKIPNLVLCVTGINVCKIPDTLLSNDLVPDPMYGGNYKYFDIDSSGNIFLSDEYMVVKLSPSGEILNTYGGYRKNATPDGMFIVTPVEIVIDKNDNAYINTKYGIERIEATDKPNVKNITNSNDSIGNTVISSKAFFKEPTKSITLSVKNQKTSAVTVSQIMVDLPDDVKVSSAKAPKGWDKKIEGDKITFATKTHPLKAGKSAVFKVTLDQTVKSVKVNVIDAAGKVISSSTVNVKVRK